MKFIVLMVIVLLTALPAMAVRADSGNLLRETSGGKSVKVERVFNASLIRLENGKTIRLIGVKALEAPKRYNLPKDEYGFIIEDHSDPTISTEVAAYDFALELMDGIKVRVESDTQSIDEDGYMFGYVFLPDGRMANVEILRHGHAGLQIRPPNLKYVEQLREAYREARAEKRGIHADE